MLNVKHPLWSFLAAFALLAFTVSVSAQASTYQMTRLTNPDRTVVTDANGNWLATFTDNAYTVTLAGAQRIFKDPNAPNPIINTTRVRVLPAPFDGTVDPDWLTQALNSSDPDVLDIALQYVASAPSITDANGLQIAGAAKYGPPNNDDTREEGGDFSDYLGISWTYSNGTRSPQVKFFQSLDCSGYMRIVWGYRAGLPMSYAPNSGASIPRHSWEMLSSAPGVIIIPDDETQIIDFSALDVGDLVFFHAKVEDHDPQIDHVGLYLGQDSAGHYRFLSSRQTINGPTFGDVGGRSLLDGTGLYAKSFRAARRL